jgi:DNA-binding CsgD family transcriptional regulator
MEQRVNYLFIIFAVAITLINAYGGVVGRVPPESYLLYIGIPSLSIVLFSILHFCPRHILQWVQVLFLFGIGGMSYWELALGNPVTLDSWAALAFWALALQLMLRYDFFIRHTILRIGVTMAILSAFILYLEALGTEFFGTALSKIAFFVFYIVVTYFLDRDVLQRYKERSESLSRSLSGSMPITIIDLKERGVTPRELEVGRVLVTSLGTDKEIAYDLDISASTVAKHLSSLREKLNVASRQHLIASMKGYFWQQDQISQKKTAVR